MFTGVCQPLAMTKWFFSKVGNNHISHLGPISLYDFFFFHSGFGHTKSFVWNYQITTSTFVI